ncbi:protein phosphatase [Aliidiomarina taiwanensis]|uniref:Protein phosphatase CheZ n=1 Tax=Aliidiomarina taiwanensis TaxID=946228 RepID=A0A432X849_9GAMM|nr:protein phosphatase CheZ [Aliidiomarina taiwanensis]RUO43049.1 protein phosphatase [Aliidiomarina taiwanensis]
MAPSVGQVTLEQAKLLVRLLETGLQAEADKLVQDIAKVEQGELFDSIGKLTRQLHDSLQAFLEDPRLAKLTADELPDAQNRLEYVIQRTEDAANRTMDAVEGSLPLVEEMATEVAAMRPTWERLMQRNLELSEFKELCHQVDGFLQRASSHSEKLHGQLTEVLMAQDFQDLTGQVIRRVIDLVQEVEGQLVSLLTLFGEDTDKAAATDADSKNKKKITGVEGPIIDPEARDDVVSGQTDVDDLLSSLGF